MQSTLHKNAYIQTMSSYKLNLMKAPVKAKSYLTTTPIHSIPYTRQDKQKIRLSFSSHKKPFFGSISESEDCLKTYFNALPEQKRKHNLSVFNFFIKKSPKKPKETIYQKRKNDAKTNLQQTPQNSHLMFEPYPSLSTEKLKIMHIDSKKKLQIKTQHMLKSPSQLLKIESPEGQNANKINQTLNKQTKFDRKKYMYYRYRKKHIQNKSDLSINNESDKINPQSNKVKRLHSFVNSKIEESENRQNQGKDLPESPVQFKRSFYRIIPQKNKSFSEIKCKLTIEPIRRQSSHSTMDRQTLSKTTRERHRMKVMQTSGTKIFSQAIHFKSGKYKSASKGREETSRERSQLQNEKILGWNFAEQQQQQQQYF